MPTLKTTTPEGIHYAFDPLTGQWTATAEDRKPTSSQSLFTLVERIKKWKSAEPSQKVVVTNPDPILAGLAGVSSIHSHQSGFVPDLAIKSLTGKIDCVGNEIQLVRYQESEKDSWLSARLNTYLLDPRTFEKEDDAYWVAAFAQHQGHLALLEAERALAHAWREQSSDDTKIIRMSGRLQSSSARPDEDLMRPITWEEVPRALQSETRTYAAISPSWPVLTGPSVLTISEEELMEWPIDATGAMRHASGVQVHLREVSHAFARFEVMRPDPQKVGPPQVLYSSSDFSAVFRLAQLTVEVVKQKLPMVTQWRASSSQWLPDESTSAPYWPILVQTQAAGLVFVNEDRQSSEIVPFVLQAEVSSGRKEGAVEHPVWKSQSRSPGTRYLPCGPADVLMDQLTFLRKCKETFDEMLEPALKDGVARLEKLHTAALANAYNDGIDGEPIDLPTATARLQNAFDRFSRKALALEPVRALVQELATLNTQVPSGKLDQARRRAPR